jgi:hypothetical protein
MSRLVDEGRRSEPVMNDLLVGHQHFCEECRDFRHMAFHIGLLNGAPRLTMVCHSCRHKVPFIYAVGGWMPLSVTDTIETYAINRLATAVGDYEEMGAEAAAGEPKKAEKPARMWFSRFHIPIFHLRGRKPLARAMVDEKGNAEIVGGEPEEMPENETPKPTLTTTPKPLIKTAPSPPLPPLDPITLVPRRGSARDRILEIRTMEQALVLARGDRKLASRFLRASEHVRLAEMEEL